MINMLNFLFFVSPFILPLETLYRCSDVMQIYCWIFYYFIIDSIYS